MYVIRYVEIEFVKYFVKLIDPFHLFVYSSMFAVVNFPNEEDSLAVIPENWCTKEGCYWPPYKSQERLKKAVLFREKPNTDTWEIHPFVLLKKKSECFKVISNSKCIICKRKAIH